MNYVKSFMPCFVSVLILKYLMYCLFQISLLFLVTKILSLLQLELIDIPSYTPCHSICFNCQFAFLHGANFFLWQMSDCIIKMFQQSGFYFALSGPREFNCPCPIVILCSQFETPVTTLYLYMLQVNASRSSLKTSYIWQLFPTVAHS